MVKCENCHRRFNKREIYKSVGWRYKPIKCDSCKTVHRITVGGRLTVVSLSLLPIMLISSFLSPFENIYINWGIGIVLFLIGSFIIPYVVKYKMNLD